MEKCKTYSKSITISGAVNNAYKEITGSDQWKKYKGIEG
jgi:hypothetical protein